MQRERSRMGRFALSIVAIVALGTIAEVTLNQPQSAFADYCGDASDPSCGFALPAAERQPYCYVTEVPLDFTLTSQTAPGATSSAQVSGTYTYPGGGTGAWRMNIVGPIATTTNSPYHTGPSWGLNNAGNPFAVFFGDLGKTNLFLTPANSPASSELVQFRPNADADYLDGNRNTFSNQTNRWAFDRTYAQYRLDDPTNQTTRPSGIYADTVLVYQRTALDNRYSDYVVTGDSLSLWVQEHGGSSYEGWSQSAIAKYTTCLTVTQTGTYVDANNNGYPDPGDHVLFTYVLTNPGSAELNGINLADTGVTMNSSNITVAGGASVTVTGQYPLTAADILNGSVTRNAKATGADLFGNVVTDLADSPIVSTNVDPEGDGEPDDPTTVTLPPPPIDLAVTKTDDADPIRIGDTVTYTITVTNNGPGTIADTDSFIVFDDLPPGLVDPTYTIPAPGVWDGPTGDVTGVKLAPGESIELTVTAIAATSGTTVKNAVTVKSPTGDPDDTNDTAVEETTIVSRADLKISKTAMPTPVIAGTDITWTITVANGGPDDATGVVVTDVIPAEVTSPTVTGCSFSGDTCTIGDLAAGDSTTITITASVPADTPAGTKIDNTASVTSTSEDTDPGNNTATVSTPADVEADVVIVKSSSPNPYVPGEPITYTFTVHNSGPSVATGVVVKDSFPAGLSGLVTDDENCGFSGADMTCDLGTLGPTDTVTITVTADTDPGLVDPLQNEAAVVSDSADPNLDNNTSLDENGATPLADLRVVKTDLADPVLAGDSIAYTVSITNLGPSAATAVHLDDDIGPAGLGLAVQGTPVVTSGDGSCAGTGCDFNTIAVGETAVVTYVIDVPQDVAAGTTVTNTAKASSPDVADPDDSNNTHAETTGIKSQADLSITKVGDGVPVPGQNYTYVLDVANAGPSIADATTITDDLPAGLTFVAADSSPTCTAAGSTVTCDVATLTSGSQTQFTIAVAVDPAFTGTIANTATVSPAPNADDPDLTNNEATDSGVASAEADLALTKSVNKSTASAGTSIEWTIVVTNNGPSTATGVTLEDAIPAGVSVTSVSSTVGATTCTTATGCAIGTLAPGDVATVTIIGEIDPTVSDGEVVVNSAEVGADPADPDTGNNAADVSTTVESVADISIVKTADPNPFTPGTPLTYNVAATNLGPSSAIGASFVDELPANFTYTGYTVTSGSGTCDLAGTTLTCSSDPMAPGAVFGVAIAGDTDAGTTAATTNIATMAAPTAYTDPKAENDSSTVTIGSAPDADLGISKTAVGSTTTPGTTKHWTVTVTNAGPTDATGVEVTDALPAGAVFVSATPSGSNGACAHDGAASGGEITCQLGELAANEIVSIDVETMLDPSIPDGADLTNTARVTSETNDSDVTNNEASATVTATRIADIAISKVDTPDPVLAGEDVTWTITVANSGPSDAGTVTVTDPVPAGFTIKSVDSPDCTTDGNDISCGLGSIAPGTAVEVVVIATASPSYVSDGLANPVTNTATAASPDDADAANNEAATTTLIAERSDVSVTKSGPAEIAVGGAITWTIDVANAGPSVADGVVVTDGIPAGVLVDPADVAGTGCSLSGTSLQCDLGRLAAGATEQIVITGTVPANYLASGNPTEMFNNASATTDSNDSNPLNNDATVGTVVTENADLAITKVGDPAEVNAGAPVTWAVTVTNNGPADAREVKVTDALPGGVTVVSATADNGGSCDGAATCLLGTVPVGSSVVVEIIGTVATDQPEGPVVNTATVGALTPDPDESNNTAEATTSVVVQANISVTKVGPASSTPGTPITYTVTVTNNGPSDATGVVVADAIPASLLNPSATTDLGTCSSATTCEVGELTAGQSAQLTFSADIDPSTVESEIVNVVSATTDTLDPDLADNEASATVSMAPAADVSLTKTGDVNPVVAGTNLTWTLTATNAGPSTATDVMITDTLPPGVQFVASPDCTGDATLECAIEDLAPGSTASATIEVTVDSDYYVAGHTSPLTNTASVTTATADVNTANNSAAETTTVADLAGVSIGKSHVFGDYIAGQEVTWVLSVLNTGPSSAQNVVATDTLPAGATFVSATYGDGQTCADDAGVVTCELGSIAVNEIVDIEVVVAIDAGYLASGRPNPISNTATVTSSTDDPTLADNAGTDEIVIDETADVQLGKTGPAQVDAGGEISWQMTVTNTGPSVARDVVVDDPAPAGVTVTSVTPTSGCDDAIRCSLGDLAPGETSSVTITGIVDPGWLVSSIGATLTNEATAVTSTPELDSTNNTSTVDTEITEAAALTVTKTDSPDPVVAGEQLTWVVSVTNDGPSTAREVSVDDPAPDGVTVTSATSSTGDSCTFDVMCTLATIAPGATETVTIVATVDPSISAVTDTIDNTATVTSPTNPGESIPATSATAIENHADLSIIKSDGGATVVAGETVSWNLEATNAGPSDAPNTIVTDTLPVGLDLSTVVVAVNPPSAGTCDTTALPDLSCRLGVLAASTGATVTVSAAVRSTYLSDGFASPMANTATLASDAIDPDPANNSSTDTTPIVSSADLTIAKTGPSAAEAGKQLTWTINVGNLGPSAASDVVIGDVVPVGLSVDSTSPGCTIAGSDVSCSIASLAVADTATVTITSTVPDDYVATGQPGDITNTATVNSQTTDPDRSNNSSSVDAQIAESADLVVTKSVAPADAVAGTAVTWTVTVQNQGPSIAQSVNLTDSLPDGFTLATATADSGASCDAAATCPLGDIAVGDTVTVTIDGSVDSDVTAATMTNTATATATTPDPDTANNTAATTLDVSANADLVVTKTGPDEIVPGTTVDYTVTVTNDGPSDAAGVNLTETLPAGLNDAILTPSQGTCTAADCALGTIVSGGTVTISVSGTLDPAFDESTLTNTVAVTGDTADADDSNNTAAVESAVAPLADVAITKSDDADPVIAGENLTWTITATNAGPSVARSVVIADTLPAGVRLVDAPGCAGTTDLSCVVGDLAPGQSKTLTVAVTVDSDYFDQGLVSPLANSATVASETTDSNSTNNTANETTTVAALAGVSIGKNANGDTFDAGTQVTWTLTVLNTGPSSAQNVVVSDPVPTGLTIAEATFDGGTCDIAATLTCDLGTVALNGKIVITVVSTVDAAFIADGNGDSIENSASVVSTTPDPEPSDNSGGDTVTVTAANATSITKTGTSQATAGEGIGWTITVSNTGPSVAQDLSVADQLPTGVSITDVVVEPSTAGTCDSTIACSFARLDPGAQIVITVDGNVSPNWFVDGGAATLSNTATVTSANDTDTGDNASTAVTDIAESAGLTIDKTASPETAIAGEDITWTVQIANAGPSTARDLTIADPAPDGVTITSASLDGGVCTIAVSCTMASLRPGDEATLTIVGTLDGTWFTDGREPTLANTATLTSVTNPDTPLDSTVTTPVGDAADLQLTKTDNADPIYAGQRITWTITTRNVGPSDAPRTVVTDTLPDGLDLSSVDVAVAPTTASCDVTALPTLTCELGTLAANASSVITVSATVPPTYFIDGFVSPMRNGAAATSTADDRNPGDNAAVETTDVLPLADVSVQKSVTPAEVIAGHTVKWALLVTNAGPSTATGVALADTIPDGIALASVSTDLDAVPDCPTSGQSLLCSLGAVAVGQTITVNVVGTVDAAYVADAMESPVTNSATVTAATPDPVGANNQSDVDVTVVDSADVSVTKVPTVGDVVAGNTLGWTITVRNDGPSVSRDVSVTDILPAGYTVGAVWANNGAPCDASGSCQLGDLAPDSDVTITITGTVDAAYTGATMTNSVEVTSATGDPDTANDNIEAVVNVTSAADLVLDKAGPASVVPGETATYSIDVTNFGPSTALGVAVTDVLPAGLGDATFTPERGSCSAAGVCDLGTLAVGDTVRVAVTASVDPALTGATITNTASVSAVTADPTPDNNADSVDSTIAAQVDVSIVKDDVEDLALAGTALGWTITVSNDGPSVARTVTVADTLPAGVTMAAPPAGCAGTTELTCDIGDLAPGEQHTLHVAVQVDADYFDAGHASPLVNGATVTTATPDTDASNNASSDTTTIGAEAGLSIAKDADLASVEAGERLTWTLTVHNAGPSSAQQVMVTDVLPTGTTFVSATPSTTGDCTVNGQVLSCAVGTLAVDQTMTVNVTVDTDSGYVSDGLPAPLVNSATVSSTTADPVMADNTGIDELQVDETADVTVQKTGSVTATAGGSATWSVIVTNTGPSVARRVTMTDAAPAGVTLTSATTTGGVGSCTTHAICELGDMNPGQAVTINLTGTIDSTWFVDGRSDTIVNSANAHSATPDSNAANNDASATTAIDESAALEITKSAATDTAIAGTEVTWTIEITNAGPSAAREVVLTDDAPPGTTIVSASGDQGAVCSFAATCSIPTLAAGATATIAITTDVDSSWFTDGGGDELTNSASVTSATSPTDNLTADATVSVTDHADVAIAKRAAETLVAAGDQIHWTLRASNAGPSDAAMVIVSDTLPEGISKVAVNAPTGVSCDTTQLPDLICTAPTLAVGSSLMVSVGATVDASYFSAGHTTPITNSATIRTDSIDDDADNNTAASATQIANSAGVAIGKSAASASVTAGGLVTWKIEVANAGPGYATAVTVDDPLPPGVAVDPSGVLTSAGSCAVSETIECQLGDLAPNATVIITVTGTVSNRFIVDTISPDGLVANTATVATGSEDPETADNAATVKVPVVDDADVRVTKSVAIPGAADPVGPATAGQAVSWTVRAINGGPSVAREVVITDALPAGFTPTSVVASDPSFVCNTAAVITCSGPELGIASGDPAAPGPEVVVTIDGTLAANYITASLPNPAVNSVSVTAATPDQTPAAATASVAVTDSANLVLTKTATPETVVAGTTVTWTLTVANAGASDARDVRVRDPLPAGLAVTSIDAADGGDCDLDAAGVIDCSLGTVAADATSTVTIVATVPDDFALGATEVSNTASVASATPDPVADPDPTVTTPIATAADIAIAKYAAADSVLAGTAIDWTIEINNAGPSTARDVQVADVIPPGVTVTAIGADDGTPCTPSAGCTFGRLDAGDTRTVNIVGVVGADYLASGNASPVVNQASVTASDPDPNPDNNTATVSTPIAGTAGLSISKTADRTTVDAGESIAWTLTVRNAGPSAATDVVVTDELPSGVEIVSVDAPAEVTCTEDVKCALGSVPAGAVIPIVVKGKVAVDAAARGATTLTNTATVATSTADPVTADNTATATVGLDARADLSLIKAAGAPVSAGGDLTWTLTVTNAGPSVATDVVASDTMPAGLQVLSAIADSGAKCTTAVVCQLGTIEPGQTVVITIVSQTPASGDDAAFKNTANVTSPTPDPDLSNNGATATGAVRGAQVGLAKRVSSAPVAASDGALRWTYTFVVENTGSATLSGVRITDDLAAQFGNSVSRFGVVSVKAQRLTANQKYDGDDNIDLITGVDALAPGATGTVDVVVEATPASSEVTLTNSATAIATPGTGLTVSDRSQDGPKADSDGDGDPNDNGAPTKVALKPNAIIGAAKRVVGMIGRQSDGTLVINYDLDVKNFGDVELSNVQLTDDLSVTFTDATAFRVITLDSPDLTVNRRFNGSSDTNLLSGTDRLGPGRGGTVMLSVSVRPSGKDDVYSNIATASAETPYGDRIDDLSDEGTFNCSGDKICDPAEVEPPDPGQEDPVVVVPPVTGSNVSRLLGGAGALIVAGAGLVLVSRRRGRAAARTLG